MRVFDSVADDLVSRKGGGERGGRQEASNIRARQGCAVTTPCVSAAVESCFSSRLLVRYFRDSALVLNQLWCPHIVTSDELGMSVVIQVLRALARAELAPCGRTCPVRGGCCSHFGRQKAWFQSMHSQYFGDQSRRASPNPYRICEYAIHVYGSIVVHLPSLPRTLPKENVESLGIFAKVIEWRIGGCGSETAPLMVVNTCRIRRRLTQTIAFLRSVYSSRTFPHRSHPRHTSRLYICNGLSSRRQVLHLRPPTMPPAIL